MYRKALWQDSQLSGHNNGSLSVPPLEEHWQLEKKVVTYGSASSSGI
jgi:hypothetical protein